MIPKLLCKRNVQLHTKRTDVRQSNRTTETHLNVGSVLQRRANVRRHRGSTIHRTRRVVAVQRQLNVVDGGHRAREHLERKVVSVIKKQINERVRGPDGVHARKIV